MKYAVIADVHGNWPMLKRVLDDAGRQGAEGFLFAGDYCIRAPWPNEVTQALRAANPAWIVRGNEEKYLHIPDGDDGQFAISRWCRQELKPEYRDWLDSLPERVDLSCEGVEIHMAHSSEVFFGDAELRRFSTRMLPLRYPDGPVSREFFRADVRQTLERDERFQRRLAALPGGVYIFGHTHSQWHARFGDHLLINPGACGQPLDCQASFGAPYTLLTVERGRATVEERRVPCDAEALIAQVKASGQYRAAPVWSELVFREWREGRENATYFLRYAEAYAGRIGDAARPFSRSTFRAAYEAWLREANPRMMVDEADLPDGPEIGRDFS